MASIQAQHSIVCRSPLRSMLMLFILPSCEFMPVSLAANIILPPSLSVSARMFFIVALSTSVPICGFDATVISSGAPKRASVLITSSARSSFMRVVSFPSENVPAPPSPNIMLLCSLSSPPLKKHSTSLFRLSIGIPRSITIGL